jgi:hypothetical protein
LSNIYSTAMRPIHIQITCGNSESWNFKIKVTKFSLLFMGSLARKEKEECTHFYLSILIESTKNVFERMKLACELISSRVKSFSCPPSHKSRKALRAVLNPNSPKWNWKERPSHLKQYWLNNTQRTDSTYILVMMRMFLH